ncbi:hypothetical protein BRC88_06645 [Halobacteriales archaeon QS_4_69_225]|nr:MAG: hypothetical protein BRC88_06645 [Halobacteriales archaeon QS_4_69_225]
MTDFQRYLAAKRSVDDRALDRRLLGRLADGAARAADDGDGPLRVLEVGTGVGTMIERLLERELLPAADVRYTAVDVDPDNVAALRERLPAWAADRGLETTDDDGTLRIDAEGPTLTVEPVVADGVAFVADADRSWDLLVGMALLDIVGLEHLGGLLAALSPGGLWYFPITFDGATRFAPAHPADRAVERAYHRHMDEKAGGDSRAGSHALSRLRRRPDATVLDVAGSDWSVRPVDGDYPGSEAALLEYVLDTVETAVGETTGSGFAATLEEWLATRRRQLEAGTLTYTTHQLDLLGRVDPPQ